MFRLITQVVGRHIQFEFLRDMYFHSCGINFKTYALNQTNFLLLPEAIAQVMVSSV